MEPFKVEHFLRANDNVPFPPYESLTAEECQQVCEQLRSNLGMPESTDNLTLVQRVAESQDLRADVNAADDAFDLRQLVSSIGVTPQNEVFVNWYRFDKIDRLAFADLAQRFQDIWYPAADDIDVFDSSLLWIVSVTHEGSVWHLTFQ